MQTAAILCAPTTLTLLTAHPNVHAVAPTFCIPVSPAAILRAALTTHHSRLPLQFHAALNTIRTVTRQRAPVPLNAPPLSILESQGMSPKKTHEVARMAAYVASIAGHIPGPLHIVDVGAGQGYLTRALKARMPAARILALDADAAQTAGAQRYERRLLPDADPPIAHRTLLVEPDALLQVVDEWVDAEGDEDAAHVPVIFVALHACGSLTPDLLRAVVAAHNCPRSRWRPAVVVAVGCCYNLLDPADFPLSSSYRAHLPLCNLPPSAFHLAAQVPATWATGSNADECTIHPSTALAIRKVVWRALLERALHSAVALKTPPPSLPPIPSKSATVPAHWPRRREQHDAVSSIPNSATASGTTSFVSGYKPPSILDSQPPIGTGRTPYLARLGRLRDDAYDTWDKFLGIAAIRMNVQFVSAEASGAEGEETPEEARRPVLEWSFGVSEDDKIERERHDQQEHHADSEADDALDELLIGPLPQSLRARARELAALHILRCLVGGVVEDAVLRDRVAWVRSVLHRDSYHYNPDLDVDDDSPEGAHDLHVRLVNLFDQATGSGRNVALVIAPTSALPECS